MSEDDTQTGFHEANQDVSPKPSLAIEELIEDGTEGEPFNPKHDTGFGTKQIVIKGQTIEVHETHGFPDVLAVYFDPPAENETTKSALELLAITNRAKFDNGYLEAILSYLAEQKPKLYNQLRNVVVGLWLALDEKNKIAQQHGRDSIQYDTAAAHFELSPDQKNFREYYYSKGVDAVADAARELDIEINLAQLCEKL